MGLRVSTSLIINEIMPTIFRSLHSANLNKVDQETIICAPFVRILEILSKLLAKETPIKHFSSNNRNNLTVTIKSYR